MKRSIFVGLILLAIFTKSNAVKAPDFTLPDIHGKSHTLSEYTSDGKYVLIDLFATWCGPCKTTAPNLSKIFHEYGDNKRQLVVLGISIDARDTKSEIEAFENTYGGDYIYPTISGADGGTSVGTSFYSAGIYEGYIPTIILVEANSGEVLYSQSGGKTKQGLLNILNTNNVPNNPVFISTSKGGTVSTQIFHNIIGNTISLQIPQKDEYNIQLFSINGKSIYSKKEHFNAGQNFINLTNLGLSRQPIILNVNSDELNEVNKIFLK